MYHLLDKDPAELDGFNAFGPKDNGSNGEEDGAGAADEVSPRAAREQLKAGAAAAAAAATASGAGGAGPSMKTGGGAGPAAAAAAAAARGKNKSGGKRGTASTTGNQRGKAGAPAAGMGKEEMRRLGLYAAFLLPLADSMCPNQKRGNVRNPCGFVFPLVWFRQNMYNKKVARYEVLSWRFFVLFLWRWGRVLYHRGYSGTLLPLLMRTEYQSEDDDAQTLSQV